MEYIALAFPKNKLSDDLHLDELLSTIKSFGYEPIMSDVGIYGNGMDFFVKNNHIKNVIYLNKSNHRRIKFNSLEITNEMSDSYLSNETPVFIKMLNEIHNKIGKNQLYIIFTEEWHDYNYVKYYEGNLDLLSNILKINLGWKTSLYNFKDGQYSSDSETSLVFKLTSN